MFYNDYIIHLLHSQKYETQINTYADSYIHFYLKKNTGSFKIKERVFIKLTKFTLDTRNRQIKYIIKFEFDV